MSRGQQVEVLDTSPNGCPEFYLVRHLGTSLDSSGQSGGSNGAPPSEGLVPASAVKPVVPNLRVSSNNGVSATENEGMKLH